MALSPNFGFPEPDNSSLVKNGAQDIRALGDSIDSFLNGSPTRAAAKNKVINGDMVIAQRATSAAGITADNIYYTVDRFVTRLVNMGTFTQTQEADAPAGFSKSVKMLCTTADASPAASDRVAFVTKLEGNSVQDLAYGTSSARTITVSFYVKSNVTGTFIAELFNTGSPARQVSRSYTISAANTWERKTFVIAGDTAQGITADNAERFSLIMWLGAGTNFTSGTLQTAWATEVQANRAVGVSNLAAAVNNYWQVTGVQIEIGSTVTPFQTATGTIQGELAACQRYYFRTTAGDAYGTVANYAFAKSTTEGTFSISTPVTMRTKPSSVDFANVAYVSFSDTVFTLTGITLNGNNNGQNIVGSGAISGATAGQVGRITGNNVSAGYLGFSAEL